MGGETEKFVSGWTVDTLKEHIDDRIDALDQRLANAINHAKELAVQTDKASELAIAKSESATASKFASVNEFRSALSDQSKNMMPRVESVQRHEANLEKLDAVRNEGVLARDALSARVDELNRRMLLREGAETGSKETRVEVKEDKQHSMAQLALVAGAVSAIMSIIVPFILAALRGTGKGV